MTSTGRDTEAGTDRADALRGAPRGGAALQRRMADLGRNLALLALAIVALIFGMGLLRGEDPVLLFLTAVSLAVAAIPEAAGRGDGPLALGSQRMLARRALIRKTPGRGDARLRSPSSARTRRGRSPRRPDGRLGDPLGREEDRLHRRRPAPELPSRPSRGGVRLCNDAVPGGGRIDPLGDRRSPSPCRRRGRGFRRKRWRRSFPRVAEVPFTPSGSG